MITSNIKGWLNNILRPINLKIETLSAFKAETKRLHSLQERGQFTRPIFPAFRTIDECAAEELLSRIRNCAARFESFRNSTDNDVGYTFANDYFNSPDAEACYAVIQEYRPARIIEVGSGHSTRVARQAIRDAKQNTELISIDPCPRCDILPYADRFIPERVETVFERELFDSLKAGDILFIDSSHQVCSGSDVVFLLLNIVPTLKPGVLLHIHDIFLPFEYPQDWVVNRRCPWNEQYLVQAMLGYGTAFDVIWPGHYFQRCRPGFQQRFPHWTGGIATSLWLRKQK